MGAFSQPIIVKLAGNIPWYISTLPTPSPSVSGTSMSSKTPGRNLEDRRSLDRLFVNQSSSKLQETFLGMYQPFQHHLKVSQEHPCPPRLQEETWRTEGVLTGFFSTNHCQTCRKYSLVYFNPSNTISKCLRSIQGSRAARFLIGFLSINQLDKCRKHSCECNFILVGLFNLY